MSGHIWRGLTNLAKKFKRKPEPPTISMAGTPEHIAQITSAACTNPSGCRIPLKCFDKSSCQYGMQQ
jgi:hypothetical protein